MLFKLTLVMMTFSHDITFTCGTLISPNIFKKFKHCCHKSIVSRTQLALMDRSHGDNGAHYRGMTI